MGRRPSTNLTEKSYTAKDSNSPRPDPAVVPRGGVGLAAGRLVVAPTIGNPRLGPRVDPNLARRTEVAKTRRTKPTTRRTSRGAVREAGRTADPRAGRRKPVGRRRPPRKAAGSREVAREAGLEAPHRPNNATSPDLPHHLGETGNRKIVGGKKRIFFAGETFGGQETFRES